MKKSASLFTGGGLMDVGLRMADYEHLWGIEKVDAIAQVARSNGLDVTTADVLDCTAHFFERPDHLHLSPPCPSFSPSKKGRKETPADIALADKCVEFIEDLRPDTLSLENVWLYRLSESFSRIMACLYKLDYLVDVQHINAADFGVPQTRQRLILRASKGAPPKPMPAPTPWQGWYDAIADLIPSLPESALAPWQLRRLKDHPLAALLVPGGSANRSIQVRQADEPSVTIKGVTGAREPLRALLVAGDNATHRQWPTTIPDKKPAYTLTASALSKNVPRAILVEGDAGGKRPPTVLTDEQPMFTLKTPGGGRVHRAVLPGKVVALTPRCFARLQTVPDSYCLPSVKRLACLVIGNGVPSLLGKLIGESLKGE